MAQQMPLPLTLSCSSKSRLVLLFLVLPFWYLLTRVVPDKFQKSSKMVVCVCVVCVSYYTTLHPLNGFFCRTTWISGLQKGKPFWNLMKQEMMGWQWHQLDHTQIICTSLQANNLSTQFLQARCPSCCPTDSVKVLKPLLQNFHTPTKFDAFYKISLVFSR